MPTPIHEIFKKQIKDEPLSDEEEKILEQWIVQPDNRAFLDKLDEDSLSAEREKFNRIDADAGWQKFQDQLHLAPLKINYWKRFAIAASLILPVLFTTYLVWNSKSKQPSGMAEKIDQPAAEIEPGGKKALLTLADGSTLVLDNLQNGIIASESGSAISKSEKGLSYQSAAKISKAGTEQYNIISTPRGGQYKVELNDGSVLYLNAESSVKIPLAFSDRERKVEVTGEVFFEIAKDPERPFIVSAGNTKISVLGTKFNLNGYPESGSVNTTLLEGSVRISNGRSTTLLRPGEQARVKDQISVLTNIDIDNEIAWRQNKFSFRGRTLRQVMSELSRIYDVDIQFEKSAESQLLVTAVISRDIALQKVLKALETTGYMHYDLIGRTVIIKP